MAGALQFEPVQRVRLDDHFASFGDEFVWEEPPPAHAAATHAPQAHVARRGRKPRTRTLNGDLARIGNAAHAHPARMLAVVVSALTLTGIVIGVWALPAGTRGLGSAQTPIEATGPAEHAGVKDPRPLRPGSHGDAVRNLQESLGALGYDVGGADGVYGRATIGAVASFQGDHGLPADGVLGPETSAALASVVTQRLESEATAFRDGIESAAERSAMTSRDAERFDAMLTKSLRDADTLPPARSLYLAVVLRDAASQASVLNGPRALALLGEIDANVRYLARHPIPAGRTDSRDSEGIAYRFFPGHGFQFHPLAAFARLNNLVTHGSRSDVDRLAAALVARAVPAGRSLTWEYYFSVNGGPRLWTSALAQAAAADALARAGQLTGNQLFSEAAEGAFRAIRSPLSRPLGGGAWVREYSFSDIAILNAQLQTIVSLSRYAQIIGDTDATAFVGRLSTAAQNLLPSFDTGCWSLYSLGGSPAPLDYHRYHVKLLETLAASTGQAVWAEYAARWKRYLEAGGCAA